MGHFKRYGVVIWVAQATAQAEASSQARIVAKA
jgi:hypothetical protein